VHNVVPLNRIPTDRTVLRRLPLLSTDAMRFVLALLSFRFLAGRSGIILMSDVIEESGIAPTSAIVGELLDAGVMGQRSDSIIVYHPILIEMMPMSHREFESTELRDNVIQMPVNNLTG
jgi:hypothetical protein